jgi:hypothetical protein
MYCIAKVTYIIYFYISLDVIHMSLLTERKKTQILNFNFFSLLINASKNFES